jgi:ABC-type glycerol-3-phosphate transport system substrate-binding protein
MNPFRSAPLSLLALSLFGSAPSLYSQSSAASLEVPKGNVTVNFWGIATQPWQVIIDDFQKTYPNIKIKWTKYSTDEIKQALRVASAAGKLPDAWFNWAAVSLRRMRRVDTPSSLRPS